MINHKEDQVRNHITWHNKNTKCKHCKENLRASNVTRHEKVCEKGKVIKKEKKKAYYFPSFFFLFFSSNGKKK